MIEISCITLANYCAVPEPFFGGVLALLMGITCAAWVAKLLVLSSAMEHLSGLLLEGSGGTLIKNNMYCTFRKITCTEFCDLTIPEGGGGELLVLSSAIGRLLALSSAIEGARRGLGERRG